MLCKSPVVMRQLRPRPHSSLSHRPPLAQVRASSCAIDGRAVAHLPAHSDFMSRPIRADGFEVIGEREGINEIMLCLGELHASHPVKAPDFRVPHPHAQLASTPRLLSCYTTVQGIEK